MTAYELAKQLLEGPDVQVGVQDETGDGALFSVDKVVSHESIKIYYPPIKGRIQTGVVSAVELVYW